MMHVIQQQLLNRLKNLLIANYPQRLIRNFRRRQIQIVNLPAINPYRVHNAFIRYFTMRKIQVIQRLIDHFIIR